MGRLSKHTTCPMARAPAWVSVARTVSEDEIVATVPPGGINAAARVAMDSARDSIPLLNSSAPRTAAWLPASRSARFPLRVSGSYINGRPPTKCRRPARGTSAAIGPARQINHVADHGGGCLPLVDRHIRQRRPHEFLSRGARGTSDGRIGHPNWLPGQETDRTSKLACLARSEL
jgi:hypothetical protein